MSVIDSKKKKMVSEDQAEYIHLCGKVWKNYVAGNEVVVVTEYKVSPKELFGEYYAVILLGIEKGLVKMKTLAEVDLSDFDKTMVEF